MYISLYIYPPLHEFRPRHQAIGAICDHHMLRTMALTALHAASPWDFRTAGRTVLSMFLPGNSPTMWQVCKPSIQPPSL